MRLPSKKEIWGIGKREAGKVYRLVGERVEEER